ncbi:hypothetical protein PILCRDRAFT_84381 [Piloderma croceum F 1598]|uniref:Uncharacterized protein n=1 Tax=Piloderma croceum (strain F 1598) TaxID=765440 RepID=A0A0C3BUU1_PILCF|nr:hypothetical protein PILCRDRAFT_84381 [Piloderma croceum F 1598]
MTQSQDSNFGPGESAFTVFAESSPSSISSQRPTPTVAKRYPHTAGGGASLSFFLQLGGSTFVASRDDAEEDRVAMDEEKEDLRKVAVEFVISLSEVQPAMVRKVDGWTAAIVRGCLDNLEVRSEADDPTDSTSPHIYEQSIDRRACALRDNAVLPLAFQYTPTQERACLRMSEVIELVWRMFNDSYPRVPYAACQTAVYEHGVSARASNDTLSFRIWTRLSLNVFAINIWLVYA